MSDKEERIRLADAITELRKEIRLAAERAQVVDPKERFRITEAEIEFTIIAEDALDGGAEVGWWVLKAKANIGHKDSTTQKVRLKLNLGDIEVGSDRITP